MQSLKWSASQERLRSNCWRLAGGLPHPPRLGQAVAGVAHHLRRRRRRRERPGRAGLVGHYSEDPKQVGEQKHSSFLRRISEFWTRIIGLIGLRAREFFRSSRVANQLTLKCRAKSGANPQAIIWSSQHWGSLYI